MHYDHNLKLTEAMEPASVAECKAHLEYPSGRLSSHCSQSQEQQGFDGAMGKFWEGQWPSLLKDWAGLSRQPQVKDQTSAQGCDSPLASDSSSSLSTRDSSVFSWSEASYSAAKRMLCSPEAPSTRFPGFSLFNPGVNHLDFAYRDSFLSQNLSTRGGEQDRYPPQKNDVLHRLVGPEQSSLDGNGSNGRPPDYECDVDDGGSNAGKDDVEGSWGSNISDLASWASSPLREFQRKGSWNEDDGICDARFQSEHQCLIATGLHGVHMGNNLVQVDVPCSSSEHWPLENDLGTMEGYTNVSNACPCKENIHGNGAVRKCDSCLLLKKKDGSATLDEQSSRCYLPDGLSNRYGIQDLDDSLRAGTVAGLPHDSQEHMLPTCSNTVVPNPLQSEDAREVFACRKTSYSAAVKERFASSTLHGYLRFATQGDSSCYSFSLDDSDEVLFARASRHERKSNKENCEWTYSFHSKKDIGKARGAWKSWPKKENLASDLVANMRVSALCRSKVKGNQDGRAKEARFVLYDCGVRQQIESQAEGSDSKMSGQPLMPKSDNSSVPEVGHGAESCIITSDARTGSGKMMTCTTCHPYGSAHEGKRAEAVKGESGLKEFSKVKHWPNHSKQAELAAIIITTSVKEKKTHKKKENQTVVKKDAAGWGMKFLEKRTESGWGLKFMERSFSNPRCSVEVASCGASGKRELPDCCIVNPSPGAACGSHSVRACSDNNNIHGNRSSDLAQNLGKKTSTRKRRLQVDVTVILPAGDHGLPDGDDDNDDDAHADVPSSSSGPTPLLDRWMSGGDCECGGWDLGCGLSVFSAEALTLCSRTANIALTRNDRMNWLSPGNPFKLFMQGYKHKKVLVLEIMEAGLFSLSFQARFSPLQAFAIAVALFHQQMTSK